MNLTISPIKFKAQKANITSSTSAINPVSFEQSSEKCYTKNCLKSYVLAGICIENNSANIKNKVQQQRKQLLLGNEFFINMEGYKKDTAWASQMEILVYKISEAISLGKDFKSILSQIEMGVRRINTKRLNDDNNSYGEKRTSYHSFDIIQGTRGCEYLARYIKKSKTKNVQFIKSGKTARAYSAKPNEEYKEANVSRIEKIKLYGLKEPIIEIYQDSIKKGKISNLSLAEKEFNKLKGIKNPSVDDVMRSCAIIQWLIAQETPYVKGSDSIANVLTKAIMHANNIFISPVKDGISLDFEAFDTDLDDYIKKYPDFFKVRPYKIERK